MYTVDISGVNRLSSQICHNRLFRKKVQQNLLHMISTEASSLATHNNGQYIFLRRDFKGNRNDRKRLMIDLGIVKQAYEHSEVDTIWFVRTKHNPAEVVT
jgi:hypothetical protein